MLLSFCLTSLPVFLGDRALTKMRLAPPTAG